MVKPLYNLEQRNLIRISQDENDNRNLMKTDGSLLMLGLNIRKAKREVYNKLGESEAQLFEEKMMCFVGEKLRK